MQTAAGIAGRKPYGISTRMYELVAWIRLETNRMLRFNGVNEKNFPSILRRSFVWKPMARFLDADYLAASYPNHEATNSVGKSSHDDRSRWETIPKGICPRLCSYSIHSFGEYTYGHELGFLTESEG